MFKNISIGLILLCSINSYACDVCGTSSLGSTSLYNLVNQKMIGISYRQGHSSYRDRSFEEWSYTAYKQVININSMWNITNALQAEVNLPVENNKRTYLNYSEDNTSLGDIQLGGNYFFQLDSLKTWVIRSSILSEVSFTKINPVFADRMNMQSTSRSIDGILSLGILKKWNAFNLFVNSKYKHSFIEFIDYRFGDVWMNEISLMYNVSIANNLFLIPQGGMYLESKKYDFENNREQHGTASENTFVKSGLQINYNKWYVGGDFSIPIYQKVIERGISQKSRMNIFLIYNL